MGTGGRSGVGVPGSSTDGRYSVGDPVTVYVNPEDARDAVLQPGGTWRDFVAVVIFGVLVLLVSAIVWVSLPLHGQ